MSFITWSQIESECGDYRAGFVATFRKYEGRDTDEIDGNNQIVKVTIASFARHAGIDDRTFRRWLGLHSPSDLDVSLGRAVGAARRFADKLPAEQKAKLAAELLEDEEVAEQVEQHRIAQRGPSYGPAPVPDEVGERARRHVGRALGHDTDQATDYLRAAANEIAHAVMCKERWGIDFPDDEAQALERIDHWLRVYRSPATVTAEDRAFAESIGVDL